MIERDTELQITSEPAIAVEPVFATVDYSKKENQIGCGYCINEDDCTEREPLINKAKKGCKRFRHFLDHFQ